MMESKTHFVNSLRLLNSIRLTKNRNGFVNNVWIERRMKGSLTIFTESNKGMKEHLICASCPVNFTPCIRFYSENVSNETKAVMNFNEFSDIKDKNKETFTEMISLYENKFRSRKGVVDFILAALKQMKEFGVEDDLETYKRLANLMPKGPYVPSNRLQVELVHFPREQDCMMELLTQMEDNGVIPDVEMGEIVTSTFGEIGFPSRKFYRMMYWMPKFKNRSPWLLPSPLPDDSFALAKLAIERITSVDLQTEITSFRTEDVVESLNKTWIISGQSPKQRELLRKHNSETPLIVEGGDHVWIGNNRVNYFVLKSEDVPNTFVPPESKDDISNLEMRYLNLNYKGEEEGSVHQQEDGIIYAVCATGTSEKDSLLSWIRLLEKNGNPVIGDLAVLFRFKKPPQELVPFSDATDKSEVDKLLKE